jgi:germination protein M
VKRRLLLGLAALPLVAGCGKHTAYQGQTTTAPPPPAPPPAVTTTPNQTIAVKVYFLRDGKIAAAQRIVPATQAVGRAALDALLEGPTSAERAAGLSNGVSAGTTYRNLAIANGVAGLELTRSLDARGRAQLVYTLTQFPTVRAVRLGAKLLTRADFEEVTPLIFVESPVVGETVTSPLRIRGTANTFEATFQVELRAGGHRVIKGPVTATSGSGTRGTFDVSLPFKVQRAMAGVLIAYELSAANGRPVHIVRIPVRLAPS